MPGTLVVCLPQISVLSAGHKYMEPLQELPFEVSKPILEEGRDLMNEGTICKVKKKQQAHSESTKWPDVRKTDLKVEMSKKKHI